MFADGSIFRDYDRMSNVKFCDSTQPRRAQTITTQSYFQ
jgi:hypothetical protein